MKKIFALAFAALAMVACVKPGNGGNTGGGETPDNPSQLTINPTSVELNVGETANLKASASATWNVVGSAVELDKTEGAEVVITAKATGNATIVASVGEQQATCKVTVKAAQGENGNGTKIEASAIWAIVLDAQTFEANKSIVKGDLRVNDETNHLYIWSAGETYAAGDGSGKSFFGTTEGYVSLTVTDAGWSGGGFCIEDPNGITALNEMLADAAEHPDQYFFHIGLKSTDNATHWFYLLGVTPGCDVIVGPTDFNDNGTIHPAKYDFPRRGAWGSIEVPLSSLELPKSVESGVNVLSFLSGGATGTMLNMDAVYFYKK